MLSQSPDQIPISKQKLIIIGLIITILNPMFAGLIYGLALWREPGLKNEGKMIFIFSLIWGSIQALILMRRFPSI